MISCAAKNGPDIELRGVWFAFVVESPHVRACMVGDDRAKSVEICEYLGQGLSFSKEAIRCSIEAHIYQRNASIRMFLLPSNDVLLELWIDGSENVPECWNINSRSTAIGEGFPLPNTSELYYAPKSSRNITPMDMAVLLQNLSNMGSQTIFDEQSHFS